MKIEEKIKSIKIEANESILTALKQMDAVGYKLLLVFKDDKFLNIVSLGDIQRAILKNIALETPIRKTLRKNTKIAHEKDSFESIKKLMQEFRIEYMPVINGNNKLVNLYYWEEVFGKEEKRQISHLNLPVVIMAGGKGTRLKPLTNVIPKPLIPIGDITIVETIMNRFIEVGCNHFYISVNYKAETIKHYFSQLEEKPYNIKYFKEDKPLGTAGSLYLIKDLINTTFFVTNCDIIIDDDYQEILKYHQENNNELTIVSALKHYPIPYGTIETKNDGILDKLVEKPELTFQINTGFYILEPHLLNEVPRGEFFHITHLIENIKKRKGRVGVFPVSEKSWKDIGDWNLFLENQNKS